MKLFYKVITVCLTIILSLSIFVGCTLSSGTDVGGGTTGADGTVVTIGDNGNWFLDGVDTGVSATGKDGSKVTIGSNYNWYIDGVDTGVSAKGKDGTNGTSTEITIGSNGNWFINGVDTGLCGVTRTPYKHVVIVGVDGAGAWFDDADMPNVDRIFENAATTNNCIASAPTISAHCWASLLTGVTPYVHGMNNSTASSNASYSSVNYPTIFQMTRDDYSRAELAVFATWGGIRGLTEGDSLGIHREFFTTGSTKLERDRQTTDAATSYIKSVKPKLTFIHLDNPDGVGESKNFGSTEHLQSLNDADAMIGDIYSAIEEAGIANDTLFIVTSDHGGNNIYHGGYRPAEYNVFFGAKGKTIIDGEIEMYQRDIAAIVCWALDVEGNTENWDSFIPNNMFMDNASPKLTRDIKYFSTKTSTPSLSDTNGLSNYVSYGLKAGSFFDDNLTDINGATITPNGNYTFVDGVVGKGVSLDTEDYLAYNDMTFGDSNFTIAFWTKSKDNNGAEANGEDVAICSNKNWGSGMRKGFVLCANKKNFINTEKTVYQVVYKTNVGAGTFDESTNTLDKWVRVDAEAPLEAHQVIGWKHIAYSVNRTTKTIEMYVNFSKVATATILDDCSFDDVYPLVIGADGNGAYGYAGAFDDFFIFNGALNEYDMHRFAKYYA